MNGHPGYSNPHRLAAYYNAQLADGTTGNLWKVGPDGRLFITDDEAVTAARQRADKARKDEEARRHNWRIMHPIDEQQEAAE